MKTNMIDKDFIFKGGKHDGKTYAWVMQNYPSYISWCKENAPNMLKARPTPVPKQEPKTETKDLKFRDTPFTSLTPNMDFWDEGPDEMSIPYLNKMKEN